MKCLEPGCKGHPTVSLERDATYTVSCALCRRKIKGHATEAAAIKAFYSKYQEDGMTQKEADSWRAKVLTIDRPEPAA